MITTFNVFISRIFRVNTKPKSAKVICERWTCTYEMRTMDRRDSNRLSAWRHINYREKPQKDVIKKCSCVYVWPTIIKPVIPLRPIKADFCNSKYINTLCYPKIANCRGGQLLILLNMIFSTNLYFVRLMFNEMDPGTYSTINYTIQYTAMKLMNFRHFDVILLFMDYILWFTLLKRSFKSTN